jgi:hypothetical protein
MIIVNNSDGEYGDVINSYYNLEQFSRESDSVLFLGYNTSRDKDTKLKYANYKNRVYLNLESPCSFCSTNSFEEESKYFTHTYTLCPYTARWLRDKLSIKASSIAFPYAEECFSKLQKDKKVVSSMYMGTIMCREHEDIVKVIKKRSHVICSLHKHPLLTHHNITSHEKWNLLASCKSNVIINMCPITQQHIQWIRSNDLSNHEAFNRLHLGFIPQFKPRVIESMAAKAVCLVKKDPWNVIENWFEPDKHFLYWETLEELENLIEDIDKNYDEYLTIVNDAFEEVKKYEIKNILDKIKEDISHG